MGIDSIHNAILGRLTLTGLLALGLASCAPIHVEVGNIDGPLSVMRASGAIVLDWDEEIEPAPNFYHARYRATGEVGWTLMQASYPPFTLPRLADGMEYEVQVRPGRVIFKHGGAEYAWGRWSDTALVIPQRGR